MTQLKEDLTDFFSHDEDFSDATVKGAYDELPKVKYPLVTILEILNQDNTRYDSADGENVSDLGYQFDCTTGNRDNLLAPDAALLMSKKIDIFIRTYANGRYKALRRSSRSANLPLTNDKTKMKSSTTYTCSVDINTNTIYKLS